MRRVTLISWAKLNLGLRILGHRHDGYHNIETILQSISLGDVVEVELLEEGDRSVEFINTLHAEDWDAPLLLLIDGVFCRLGWKDKGIRVKIDKRIPVGAGLGGSSADGAGLLRALMYMSGEEEILSALAPEFGSDLPGMVVGGRTRCKGRGERVESLTIKDPSWFGVVVPEVACDTGRMYDEVDHGEEDYSEEVLLVEGVNDFEIVARSLHGEVDRVFESLAVAGAPCVSLSGSGSAVFVQSEEKEELERWLLAAREATGSACFICQPLSSGHQIILNEWGVAKR